MMVSSTGTDGAAQPAYLGQVLSDLPSEYPLIKAVVYFDGPDMVSGDQDQLGVAGLASLGYLMASPYFNPTARTPSRRSRRRRCRSRREPR